MTWQCNGIICCYIVIIMLRIFFELFFWSFNKHGDAVSLQLTVLINIFYCRLYVEPSTCFVPWFAKPLSTTVVAVRSYRNNTGVTTVVNRPPRQMNYAILVYNIPCLCMHWDIRHMKFSWWFIFQNIQLVLP